jgi:hypothetical protein
LLENYKEHILSQGLFLTNDDIEWKVTVKNYLEYKNNIKDEEVRLSWCSIPLETFSSKSNLNIKEFIETCYAESGNKNFKERISIDMFGWLLGLWSGDGKDNLIFIDYQQTDILNRCKEVAKQLNVIGGTVKDLLTKLIDKYDKNNRGDWSELEYSLGCDDFDYGKLNDQISNIFDDIIDGIQENEEFEFMNFEEYSNYLDYIQKLGGFGTVMTIPKSENKKFVITDLDRSTNKATIAIDTGERDPEYRKLSMDELNSFLYNYELFNENRLKLWKIMKEIY